MDNNFFVQKIATKFKSKIYTLPIEKFRNTVSEGWGIRYILGESGKAFRLNFDSKNASILSLDSIDIWNGTSHDPNTNIQIDNLQEQSVDQLVDILIKNLIAPDYGSVELNPNEAEGDNTTHINIKQGGSSEEYAKSQSEAALSGQMQSLSYQESLKDLRSLVVSLVKGVSNALFVFGAGGLGKTTAVEKTLHDIGLRDGDGYFQVAGSTSAPVIYQSLYNNKDSIVLFDDCDAVLRDENGRNIIKAATDSKKQRKLSYLKQAAWLYNPEKTEVPEEEIGVTKFPNNFVFEGRVIFISNLQLDELDPDGSIRTRCLIIGINPAEDEILAFMEKILDQIRLEGGRELDHASRVKALKLVKGSTRKGDLSLRKLVRVMNFAASGIPNWERLALLYA